MSSPQQRATEQSTRDRVRREHQEAKRTGIANGTCTDIHASATEQALSTPDPDEWPARDRIPIAYDGSGYGGSNTTGWRVIDGVAGTQTLKHLQHMDGVHRKNRRRGVIMRDSLTPSEVGVLLKKKVDTIRKRLKDGHIPGRQPTGEDGDWEIPISRFKAHLLAHGYTQDEVHALEVQWSQLVYNS